MLQFIDTHIHLQDFKPDFAPPVLQHAAVKKLVLVSAKEDDYEKIAELMRAYPEKINGAFGVHPWYAQEEFHIEILREKLKQFPKALVGEIGVDELKEKVSQAQHQLFSAQLAVAKEFNRAVIVHAAKAFNALTEHEAALKQVKYVYHGYTKNNELLKFIIRTGGYIGLSELFFIQPKAAALWQTMPKDRILFESDAPYRIKEEKYLQTMQDNLLKLSEIAGMNAQELAELLMANTVSFLK